MKPYSRWPRWLAWLLSVLSVEPYGMKLRAEMIATTEVNPFSALGRAVWDETRAYWSGATPLSHLSVLSVEPYGMKLGASIAQTGRGFGFQCSRSSRMG